MDDAARAAIVFTRDPQPDSDPASLSSRSSSSSATTGSAAADQDDQDDHERRQAEAEEQRMDESDRVHVPRCDVDGPRIVRFTDVSAQGPRPGERIELASTVVRHLQQDQPMQDQPMPPTDRVDVLLLPLGNYKISLLFMS